MRLLFIFILIFPASKICSQEYFNIVSNSRLNLDFPLEGWSQPIPILNSTASVHFNNGYIGFYKFTNSGWQLVTILTPNFRNNIMIADSTIERGNVLPGGGQAADFTRNIYNWLGSEYSDIWQSVQDSNLFQIKGSQMVNLTNTTNSNTGAINIGTNGDDGQYKLNVHGGVWLDNGRNSMP